LNYQESLEEQSHTIRLAADSLSEALESEQPTAGRGTCIVCSGPSNYTGTKTGDNFHQPGKSEKIENRSFGSRLQKLNQTPSNRGELSKKCRFKIWPTLSKAMGSSNRCSFQS